MVVVEGLRIHLLQAYVKYKRGFGIVFYGSLGPLRKDDLLRDFAVPINRLALTSQIDKFCAYHKS